MKTKRHDKLDAFLDEIGAEAITTQAIGRARLDFYMCGGKTFYVHRTPTGFEIYAPVSESSKIADTFEALRNYVTVSS